MVGPAANRNAALPAIVLALFGLGLASCSRTRSVELGDTFISVSEELGPVFAPPDGGKLGHVFTVPNPSKTQTMELKLVQRNCDCSDPIIEQARIEPGGEGKIQVSVPMSGGLPVKKVAMQFATGLTDRPDLFVRLLVHIHPRICIDPSEFASIELLPGEEKVVAFDVNVHQPADEAKAPVRVQAEGEHLTVTVLSTKERTEGQVRTSTLRGQAKVHCPNIDEASYPDGPVEGRVTVRHKDYSLIRRINWRGRQVIALEPKKLFLRASSKATSIKAVRLSAAEPFAVVSVACDAPFLRVRLPEQEARTEQQVEIEFSGTAQENSPMASTAEIEFRTDHPQQEKIRLPVFVLWAKVTDQGQPETGRPARDPETAP